VWIVLAAAVPAAIGLTMALRRPVGGAVAVRPPTDPVAGGPTVPHPESRVARLLRGVPITFGLAASFLIVFVTVPALRVIALVRRWVDVQVPLVTENEGYERVAAIIERTLAAHKFDVRRGAPPWWVSLPSRLLLRLGGPAFREYVPERLMFLAGPRLEAALYPNGLLLRGLANEVAWAHGVIVEALTSAPAYQTFDPRAQDVEKQIRSVWQVYRQQPEAHRGSRVLLARLMEITREIRTLPVTYDEWQIVYRQALQLGRALDGAGQLLEDASLAQGLIGEDATLDAAGADGRWEETTMAMSTNGGTGRVHTLSTPGLIGEITGKASMLARKEVMLARAELRADVQSELAMLRGLAPALVAALLGVQMLLTALVFALTRYMPGWLAALALGVGLLVAAGVAGYVSWSRRVTVPMALTRKTLKEDLRWAKERMA
jgi:hypothetical protein